MQRLSIALLGALVLLVAGAFGGSLVGANTAPPPERGRIHSALFSYQGSGSWESMLGRSIPAGYEFVLKDLWVPQGTSNYHIGIRRTATGAVEVITHMNLKTEWSGGVVLYPGDELVMSNAGLHNQVGWSGVIQ